MHKLFFWFHGHANTTWNHGVNIGRVANQRHLTFQNQWRYWIDETRHGCYEGSTRIAAYWHYRPRYQAAQTWRRVVTVQQPRVLFWHSSWQT